jgi:hypothetical protein
MPCPPGPKDLRFECNQNWQWHILHWTIPEYFKELRTSTAYSAILKPHCVAEKGQAK